MNILLTGGSGNLGKELQKLASCIAPSANELDVTDAESCKRAIEKYAPDIIIHAAAYTDVGGAEKNKAACWAVNVTGTENIAKAALGRRLIYISTDYVFDGEKGNYREDDIPNPTNFYALTKLAGELIVRQYPPWLIIRTAFKPDGWAPEKVFHDKYGGHEFVSVLAPDIFQAAAMPDLVGVVHIVGERKRMSDLAPQAQKIMIADVVARIPRDTSLNTSLWQSLKSSHVKK